MMYCDWSMVSEAMIRYHNEEWGVPLHDDQKQFEFLMMEVMQCGLNWNMMLQKREIFRHCFANFVFAKVAAYGEEDIKRILATPGMIRSRSKVEAIINDHSFACPRFAELTACYPTVRKRRCLERGVHFFGDK